ncbi:hypothetical protein HB818_10545 [Listeria booriae]|uniref:hypothetical protein n=1 Tax=Listeria booriae TaxID=1552123 RepID=UPI0016264F32|nr:hypothetical protein [Listeria booriae]MBC1286192.1 hypothetical protein [Listeria booriae]
MLNNQVSEVLEKYYKEKNNDLFLKEAFEPLNLPTEITQFCVAKSIKIKPMQFGTYPSEQWYFKIDGYKNNDFEVSYISILTVSKLAPIYRLEHNFEVVNKDPKKISPTLDGSAEEGHSFLQADLDRFLKKRFEKDGHSRMFESEATRKIEGVNFSEDVILFGPDVTQEDILFRDVLDILPD